MSSRSREIPEIKMFISQPEIDTILKKDDQATAYIIHQNSVLTQRIMDLTDELNTLEKEKEEIEMYNERLEKTRTCLQGYVRNEHDMMLKYKQLYTHESSIINSYKYEFAFTQIVPVIIFIISLLCTVFIGVNAYFLGTVYVTLLGGYVTIIYSTYMYLQKKRFSTEINEIIADITKTTQSNVYIDDLIDNM